MYYEKSASVDDAGAIATVETWKLFGGEYLIRRDGIEDTVTVSLSNGQSVVATVELDEGVSGADTSEVVFLKSAIQYVTALEAGADGSVEISSGVLHRLRDAAKSSGAKGDQNAAQLDARVSNAVVAIAALETNSNGNYEIDYAIPRLLAARVLYRYYIKESGNEAVVQVKGNQKTLLNDCQTIAETTIPDEVYQEPMTKTRNRIESRKVEVFIDPILTHAEKWNLVKVVVKVERFRQVFDTKTKSWKNSDETSFYISTIGLSAQEFCQAIRNHWGIENRNHHVRDVTMGEDKSRIRTNPHIFAKLRSFALNILRKNQVENVSLELFDNCMNLDNVLNYVGVL